MSGRRWRGGMARSGAGKFNTRRRLSFANTGGGHRWRSWMKYFLDKVMRSKNNTGKNACATWHRHSCLCCSSKKNLVYYVTFLLFSISASAAPALMPLPAQMSLGKGKLTIDSSFSVRVSTHSDRRLEAAVARLTSKISRQTGIPITGGEKPALIIECRESGTQYP